MIEPSTMMARGAWVPLALLLSALLGFSKPDDTRSTGQGKKAAAAIAAASCTLCHPGEKASLARSVHAPLSKQHGRDASCLQCHTNGIAHQNNAKSKKPEHAPGSGAASCASCHEQLELSAFSKDAMLRSSHPSKRDAARAILDLRSLVVPPPADVEMTSAERSEQLRAQDVESAALRLEGLVRAGLRLVDVDGSQRIFDHDWNLDAGARLSALELRALRGDRELFELDAGGVEDRSFWLQGSTGRALAEDVSAKGGWRRTRWVYEGDDDWATLSNKRDRGDASVVFELEGMELELGWERDSIDGRSIASSIGNPNANPLNPARKIPIDRRFVSDRIFAGAELPIGTHTRPRAPSDPLADENESTLRGALAVEIGWETMRQRDELRYTRPSNVSPGFNESELSSSRASRRGLDGSLRLALGEDGGRELRALFFALDHDVKIREEGELVSFDTSAFQVDTVGDGSGSSRFLSGEVEFAEPIWNGGRLLVEAAWRDQRDLLRLDLTETTIRPPNQTITRSVQDTRVRNTEREFRAGLEQAFLGGDLVVEAAFRYLEQDLEVPDLALGDNDFRAGTIRTSGPELAADLRPAEHWRVRALFRFAGTDDALPNETQPEVGHFAKLRIRRRVEDMNIDVWAKWRRGENDVASTEIDQQSYGVAASFSPWTDAQLQTSVGFSRIRSETLTNFYFAPSLTPVPTLVEYRGDVIQADVLLETPLSRKFGSTTTVGFTHTDGSLDTIFWRLDEELLRLRLDDAWSLGLRASFFEYEGDTVPGRREGYDARLAFLFAEFRF